MPSVIAFHRPQTLDDAADLLKQSNSRALVGHPNLVPTLLASTEEGVEAVDLQQLGLDTVSMSDEGLVLGAMATLSQLIENDNMPDSLRELAKREQPSTLRPQATVGGALAAGDNESLLVAALLAMNAKVTVRDAATADPTQTESVAQYLAHPANHDRLLTEVRVQAPGSLAVATTGRTPADTPIVAAVGRAHHDGGDSGSNGFATVALTGVADTVVAVTIEGSTDDDVANAVSDLAPAADFRGSSEYRRHLAVTLTRRVVAQLANTNEEATR